MGIRDRVLDKGQRGVVTDGGVLDKGQRGVVTDGGVLDKGCLLYPSPSPRDRG